MIKLHVISSHKNGINGHLTVHAKIVEERDGRMIDGTPETYGIDPLALQSKFGGDVELWRKWITDKMLTNHRHRTVIHGSINDWTGKKFVVEE